MLLKKEKKREKKLCYLVIDGGKKKMGGWWNGWQISLSVIFRLFCGIITCIKIILLKNMMMKSSVVTCEITYKKYYTHF